MSTVSGTPSVSCVARASQAEGVVTASLAAIEKRVSGRKLGSLPTSVMSVPCRVVTSAGRGGAAGGVGGQDLARQMRAHGVGERVVRVDDVEPLAARDLDDLRGERQRVGGVFELRVGGRGDAVEGDVRLRRVEPARDVVAEDVHGVPAARQRGGDLRRHHAAAAEGREADDADPERRRGLAHGSQILAASVGNGPTREAIEDQRLSVAGPTRPASDGQP